MFFLEFDNIEEFLRYARGNNHSIICIENTNNAKEIGEIVKYPVNPIFVTGHENTGVPKEILDEAHRIVKINQGVGYVNCLNTGIAFGIVLHDFFKKEISRKQKQWN